MPAPRRRHRPITSIPTRFNHLGVWVGEGFHCQYFLYTFYKNTPPHRLARVWGSCFAGSLIDLYRLIHRTNAIPTGASSGGASGTKAAAPATTGAGVGEVMFQFFGPKIDSSRVREAMEKMTERGRIGNVSLVPGTKLSFRQDVGLMLQVGYVVLVRPTIHTLDTNAHERYTGRDRTGYFMF